MQLKVQQSPDDARAALGLKKEGIIRHIQSQLIKKENNAYSALEAEAANKKYSTKVLHNIDRYVLVFPL